MSYQPINSDIEPSSSRSDKHVVFAIDDDEDEDDEDIGEEDTEDSNEPQVEAMDSKDVIQRTLTPNALLHVEDGVDRPRK